MTFYIESVYIGIIAWIYAGLLTESGMILARWHMLLQKLPQWLFKPLVGCSICVAGQMALWYGIYLLWSDYNVIDHILFISVAILTANLINTIDGWLTKD